jgi:methionyl-tRNA synthetase
MENKSLFVSTSIAYLNGDPHLGFAMESIEADVISRWNKNNNIDTFFSTGTDEHGEKIHKTAELLKTSPKDLCDKNVIQFKNLAKELNIDYSDFIRTSDQSKHWKTVQLIWTKLVKSGDIYKKKYTGLYCYGCEAFMTAKDLDEEGTCPNHKRKPNEISEENYFFKLSKYSSQIEKLIESNELEIIPSFRKNEILNLIKDGLHDVSFSRPASKLPWGIPVPNDDTQTMYVWCDALSNYISVLDYYLNSDLYKKYWINSEVIHVIGKDILRFHSAIWIGMLLSIGEKTPDKLLVHGFLTSEGEKMSKSTGNIVDPFKEIKKYGSDALRYFLIREVPIGQDADFSKERFNSIYQSHLANGLGNLVSRVISLANKNNININSKIEIFDETEYFLNSKLEVLKLQMSKLSLHESIKSIFQVIDYCDKKINDIEPWKLIKVNPEKNKVFVYNMLYCINWISIYLYPFLPVTAEKIKNIINSSTSEILFPRLEKLK